MSVSCRVQTCQALRISQHLPAGHKICYCTAASIALHALKHPPAGSTEHL